jgi:hypothetical protein
MKALKSAQWMKLLPKYIGRDAEIKNDHRAGQKYHWRGPIEAVEVVEERLLLKFSWLAEGVGGFPPTRWVVRDNLVYTALTRYLVVFVEDDVLTVRSKTSSHVTIILHPPGGSKLDPKMVRGLVLPADSTPTHLPDTSVSNTLV